MTSSRVGTAPGTPHLIAVGALVVCVVAAAVVRGAGAEPAETESASPGVMVAAAASGYAAPGYAATGYAAPGYAAPREIVVSPTGPVRSITAAVALARAGDRVRVLAGEYREGMIVIDRRMELIGEGYPVLDAGGTGQVLRVTADSVVVRGFALRGSGISHTQDNAALQFDGVSGCIAEDNRLDDNFFGIYLARTTGCRVTGNVIRGSGAREATSGNGIHLWNTKDVVVENNDVRGQRDGIYLEHVNGAVLRGNVSAGNLRYGLHFMFSSDNAYIDNTFRDNGAGVAVMYSKDVRIEGNSFEDNWGATAYGLLLKEISDSRITGNSFTRNTVGVSSEGSMRIHVANNRFVRNGWAARVMANSQHNDFVGNDFIENSFDVTTNSRSNFNTFSGNYWSRYTGYDLDGDGVGDVPFRPVRLFSLLVQRSPVALVLLRSVFVDLLDIAERVVPVLTPETLVDNEPRMREAQS
jgi:nitrous oxidase accessory protein